MMEKRVSFQLLPMEFFFGAIRQPDGDGEETIIKKGSSRDAVVKHTIRAADDRNWDWVIELRRDEGDDTVTTLAHWSSLQGELPPGTRKEVLGIN